MIIRNVIPQLPIAIVVSIAVGLSCALHLLYFWESGWGDQLVTAYLRSDAHYYFYKAWFSAFVDSEGGKLSKVISPSPYIGIVSVGFSVFGSTMWVPYLVASIFTATTCGFIALLSARLFNSQIALLSGTISALCGVFIFYSGLTLKSSFVLFGVILSLYFCVRAIQDKSYTYLLLGAVTIVVTAYDRDNYIFTLFPLLYFFVSRKTYPSLGWGHVLVSFAIVLFAYLSVKFVVGAIWGQSGISSLIGVNFYMGNAPGATGGYTPLYGVANDIIGMRLGIYELLTERYGRDPTSWELHTHLLGECFYYYAERPFDYLLLKTKHFALLFSQYAYGFPEQYAFWRYEYSATTLALVDWRVVLSFSFVFLIYGFKDIIYNKALLFLVVAAVIYACTVWIFLVTERYRLVLYVFFIPLAGAGLYQLLVKPRIGMATVVGSVFLASTLLNSTMQEKPGWSFDLDNARSAESTRRDASRKLYQAMHAFVNHKDAESAMVLIGHLVRERNCEDAIQIAKIAQNFDSDIHFDRIVNICNQI